MQFVMSLGYHFAPRKTIYLNLTIIYIANKIPL
jgi:hypothetical protein